MTIPTRIGSEFLVNTTTQNGQFNPTITALSDGRFVVAWTDESRTGGDTSSSAIRAQIFDAGTGPSLPEIRGTAGSDDLAGTAGADAIFGMAGDDFLEGGQAMTFCMAGRAMTRCSGARAMTRFMAAQVAII